MKWSFNKAARTAPLLQPTDRPSGVEWVSFVQRRNIPSAAAIRRVGNFTAAANFAPVVAAEQEKEEEEGGLHFEWEIGGICFSSPRGQH